MFARTLRRVFYFAIGAIAIIFACGLIANLGDDAPATPEARTERAALVRLDTPTTVTETATAAPLTTAQVAAAVVAQPIATRAAEAPTETPTEAAQANELGTPAQVINIVDGDTIDVLIDGVEYRVRYILVDTPERGMPYFTEASAFNATLVGNQTVYLVKDVSETDRYGRLLRYVYLADGMFVNEALVRAGFAQIATFPPDVSMEAQIRAAQAEARDAGRGLWAAPVVEAATATPVPAEPVAEQPASNEQTRSGDTIAVGGGGQCDPAYPDVCIPPYAVVGDLDCGDVPQFARFRVLPPDPHGLDGRDNDGWGCEGN